VVYVTSRWIWLPLVALAVASCAEGVPTTPDLSATDIDVGDDAADAEPDTPDLEEVTAIETGPDARLLSTPMRESPIVRAFALALATAS
jgi:hypothetical protein